MLSDAHRRPLCRSQMQCWPRSFFGAATSILDHFNDFKPFSGDFLFDIFRIVFQSPLANPSCTHLSQPNADREGMAACSPRLVELLSAEVRAGLLLEDKSGT